ncbi:2-oxoglutarate dehydrogenase complex dihydrolipoyllysine-residue succinyltransferase [Desulfofustis glycolicus]|uniref:Dihydrolipoyllysine-residue succinyltransferase component of 2-oxoglutarate dehydrogenase complex n=1 Tax=Desulfofustis glycolicus DSM 9705 TaxID=1121409 RepID=A0A1M5XQD3_9BACT|nr:2-oxoglutarate dehydrogenase complex dihydrolipoyllysine-residue succinyltransferase [Desulfofustis glycolicus]MCB2217889.1 2-oxoglutarate dehydrogenase complex dihydrolipoyllysine-residue succinyltransferase [Desulfobulbaceae bacterium]SHI01959.1 2-oxoglutarate dehydrogenase E2 component [Desulfofustis glycolicus DSM 9705]
MIIDVEVPELGESITEVEVGEWLVATGDSVQQDDPLVAIESEKATVELPAPQAGVLVEIVKQQGEVVPIGEIIARIDTTQTDNDGEKKTSSALSQPEDTAGAGEKKVMPAAAGVLARNQLSAEQVAGSGPGGRILKEDAVREAAKQPVRPEPPEQPRPAPSSMEDGAVKGEHRVPMTLLRRTVASRLVEAKQSMAMLTTFNEVDMSQVKQLRATLGTQFSEKHGVRLGFMSFFVKAAIGGLGDFPLVNARIEGNDIVYHDYCDIGVAIGGGKGLVVPVIRRAEQLSFADIERTIADFGQRAKNSTLSPEELSDGTFTISNGGVYGSMLSTPIINPPQSAILGLHAIKDRPVVVDGEITIRPLMYLALSYDHRIIDGREAVSFLKSIKERIEMPEKLLLEI